MSTNSNSGTILKVVSPHFTKEELEELRSRFNTILNDIEKPNGIYTRHTSDFIKSLRDIAENLILAGAIPEAPNQKDTARYVWKKLKERNIPYDKSTFYTYFSPEQKRDWQTNDDSQTKPSDHKHEFQKEGFIEGMGEVSRCATPCNPKCFAMLIDGRLFEQQELEEKEPELKKQKKKTNYEIENDFIIEPIQKVISRFQAILSVWRTTSSNLTKEERKELKESFFHMEKAGEFLDMCYDRKNMIHSLIQHLLVLAYGEGTQKVAGGIFIKYRIDLAKRNVDEGIDQLTRIQKLKKYFKSDHFAKFLSEKQTVKAMRGLIRKLNPRYEPQNEKQAMDTFFSGQQCINCKYWRVGDDQVLNPNWKEGKPGWKEGDDPKDKPDPVHEKYDTMLVCFHCGETQKRKHFILPKQNPQVMIDYSTVT